MGETKTNTVNFYGEVADRLGKLRADIKVLTDKAKDLEDTLKKANGNEFDGNNFRVTVSDYTRITVNYKEICRRKKVDTKYMVKTYAKETATTKVCVKAHKK